MSGRNDPCPCGSQKKYKKCCLNKTLDKNGWWNERAAVIGSNETLSDTFFSIHNHSIRQGWRGACHATSSLLHILLREQGIESQLKLGFAEAETIPFAFCHSWVEVDGKPYDIGIYRPNRTGGSQAAEASPPIFSGINLETNEPTTVQYGVETNRSDRIYNQLAASTLGDYMQGWPDHKEGLWKDLLVIGERLNIRLNMDELRAKYADVHYHTP